MADQIDQITSKQIPESASGLIDIDCSQLLADLAEHSTAADVFLENVFTATEAQNAASSTLSTIATDSIVFGTDSGFSVMQQESSMITKATTSQETVSLSNIHI